MEIIAPATTPATPIAPLAQDLNLLRNTLNTLILLQSHLRLVGEKGANTMLASARLFALFEQLFASREALTIAVARHGFLFADNFIDRSSRNLEKFANLLFQHGIATLTITAEITPQAIHTFLALVNRKVSETWDEGGMPACLQARKIVGLVVGEMQEQHFQLTEAEDKTTPAAPATSLLWEKYALAVAHGLHLPDGATDANRSPAALASAIGAALQERTAGEKTAFASHAGRFLLSLSHEKVRSYRDDTVRNLTAFINELPADLRRLFLSNAFNLNLDADLAADFIGGLSDQSILDALKTAADGQDYTPPVILRLLGKIADMRGLASETTGTSREADASMIADLFRADGFAEYVPEAYQGALLRIIQEDQLPIQTEMQLDRLKQSLEPAAIEEHLGRVLLQIFRQAPEAQHLAGMCDNLRNTIDFYLSTDDFGKIAELLATVTAADPDAEIARVLLEHASAESFINKTLDAVNRLGREKLNEFATLILYLKEPFVEPLFDRLNREANRSTRLVYLGYLKQLGDLCSQEAIRWLADERWYVVRNMLLLLREIGNPAVLPEIRGYLLHDHPRVRNEALVTCLLFRDQAAVGHLLNGFAAKDATEVLRAVTLAAQVDDPEVIARLLDMVRKSSLFDFRLELRRAAVRSLAAQAPPEALPVFATILTASELLHSVPHEQLRLEIIATLDRYPPNPAAALLRQHLADKSARVAQAARIQLKKITAGKE